MGRWLHPPVLVRNAGKGSPKRTLVEDSELRLTSVASSRLQVLVRCADSSCPFRVEASVEDGQTDRMIITKHVTHSCKSSTRHDENSLEDAEYIKRPAIEAAVVGHLRNLGAANHLPLTGEQKVVLDDLKRYFGDNGRRHSIRNALRRAKMWPEGADEYFGIDTPCATGASSVAAAGSSNPHLGRPRTQRIAAQNVGPASYAVDIDFSDPDNETVNVPLSAEQKGKKRCRSRSSSLESVPDHSVAVFGSRNFGPSTLQKRLNTPDIERKPGVRSAAGSSTVLDLSGDGSDTESSPLLPRSTPATSNGRFPSPPAETLQAFLRGLGSSFPFSDDAFIELLSRKTIDITTAGQMRQIASVDDLLDICIEQMKAEGLAAVRANRLRALLVESRTK